MAERNATVNINYRVNTTELDKAAQSAQAAQAATEKLRQSSTQTGAAAQKGYQQSSTSAKQYGTSLEALRIKQQQLAASISLTNKNETKRLKDLSQEYKAVSKEIQSLTNQYLKLTDAQKQSNAQQTSGIQGLQGLVSAVRSFIAVGLVKEIVQSGIEAAKLAGTVETVGSAFRRQIPQAEILLGELRRATRGTVTDLELMQRTLQAKNLGIAVESLPKLLEFAAVRAQQTGVSVDYLVNSIVNGIGRKSLLILDNLGISAVRLKEQFNGASLASQSVGEVTRAVARIAQEEMQKMGGYVENSATKVDQLSVSYHELGVEISKTFANVGIVDALKDYADSFKDLFEAYNRGITVAQLYEDRLRNQQALISGNEFVQRISNKAKEEQIRLLEAEIKRSDELVTRRAQFIQSQQEVVNSMKEELKQNILGDRELEKQIELRNKIIATSKDEALYESQSTQILRARLQTLTAVNEEEEKSLGIIEKQRELIKTITDEQSKATTEEEIAELNKELDEENKELQRLLNLGKERLGLIQKLQDKLKELREEQEKANNPERILEINAALEQTQAELNDLLGLGKSVTKMFSEIRKQLDNTKIIEGLFPKDSNALKGSADKLSKDYIDRLKQSLDERLKAVGNGEGAIDLGINIKVGEKLKGTPFIGPDSKPTGGLVLEIVPDIKEDAWDKIAEEFARHRNDLISTGIFSITDVITSGLQAEADAYDQRLTQLKDYYDQQIAYAGDNEQAKDRLRQQEQKKERKLRLEAFEADKEYKRKATLINGAAAVINAFATLPYPAAIVASIAIAAETAAQLANINKQQPRFAKGVINLQGPGTATSDSIQARLSKGESVMTAAETRGSFQVLKAVRAGKLNDEVMKEIVRGSTGGSQFVGQTFDASPIVNEIRELRKSQPNYAKDYGVLYETRQSTDNFKRKARSKSMSI